MEIREQLARYKNVSNIMHLVNKDSLQKEHRNQLAGKAKGVDGVNKALYEQNLGENLNGLIQRMKKFQYQPLPVRRTYIPKLNGKLRPLGIPAYEDKLVQGVMSRILNEIYEHIFLDCSYGFRPRRGCHDAIKCINNTLMFKSVNWILEADIKGFFDHVNHDWLIKFLSHVINDLSFIRYIVRFLKAGIMEDGMLRESSEGTPQGGLISPILANVYLHYVLDLWVEYHLKGICTGKVYYVRYADDFVLLFELEEDARQTMDLLKSRLAKFSLEVAEDKTRILPFGRN